MKTCMSLLAVLLCSLSGCGQVNTRIGWPWTYWEHGFWAVVGVLAIYGLMPVFLGLVISIAEDYKPALFGIVVVLLVAGLVLQLLPPTTSGIQFVSLPPWHCVSWFARIVSVACWIFIALAGLCALTAKREEKSVAGLLLFFALGLNALLSFATAGAVELSPTAAHVVEIPPPTRQIAQWERRREQQTHLLAKLLSDKESLVARIKNLGVTSKKELMTHGVGRILVEELSELCRQITLVRSDVETLETATEEARSRMRCLERETVLRGTKITDEQYRQMSGTVHVLEELRRTGEPPGSEVRTDKLLDEVFAR